MHHHNIQSHFIPKPNMHKKKHTHTNKQNLTYNVISLPIKCSWTTMLIETLIYEHITIITAYFTFWHHKGRNTTCSNCRHQGISLLVYIDTSVPTTPWLGGSKHSPASAHVSKSSLTGTMSTSTTHTRNTCHSTPSSPWLSTSLMTYRHPQLFSHTVTLCQLT